MLTPCRYPTSGHPGFEIRVVSHFECNRRKLSFRDGATAPDPESIFSAEKDALILTLLARVEELAARGAALEAEKAALRARLA
ncbi:MAG: hypothetical protein ACREFQ_04265, partial [Stellaceae bacterium]